MSDYKPMTCLPVLAQRGLVVFPGYVTHFDVGRTKSARAVEEAMRTDQSIFLVAQRDLETDDPKKADLYEVGTVATVKQILRLPGDNMRILVEGRYRAKLLDMIHSEPYLFGRVVELDEAGYNHGLLRLQALVRQAHELFGQFIDLAVKSGQESMMQALTSDEPGRIADIIGQNATFPYDQKQQVLEQLHPVKRLELAVQLLARELDILQLESEISEKVQESVNKNTICASRSTPSAKSLARRTATRKTMPPRSARCTCRRQRRKSSSKRFGASVASRAALQRPTLSAIILIRCSIFRGTRRRRSAWM